MEELRKQFEELLRALRDFQLLPMQSRNSNAGDTASNDIPELQKTAELATETFRSSFGERLGGSPDILSSMPFQDAIATMMEWTSQLLSQNHEQSTFSTIEECSSWLGYLGTATDTSVSDDNTRASWPFIQKVRVYLNAYILSKGLIIADLPGLRDLNSARQAITERYVRQCHQIFVVARIDRAITDESIKSIFETARHGDVSKVDIVCTRSEDIQMREAVHDYPAERANIEAMQSHIADAERELESLRDDIEEDEEDVSNFTREKERKLNDMRMEFRKAEKEKESYILRLKRLIVDLRNSKVSRGLRKAYCKDPNATSLSIFCVSNKDYWDNRNRPAHIALEYLQLSGILELRRYCIGVVAQSRLQATQTFIKDGIPALIGSVELWVEAGSGNASAESKQRVLHAVATIQQEVDKVGTFRRSDR
jgi:hypothetical protein